MSATHLGFYNTSSSRTHVRFQFSTHAAAGGNVAPGSAFEAADLRIYKASDGAAFSATQRSSANGITMTSPFDSLTGFHDVDIDLTDNTDSGFYASGGFYSVVLAPDSETVDSQTITGVVLAYFEIGLRTSNVVQVNGTTQTAGDLAALINAVDDYIDTELAAIKAKTDNLPSDPADASDIAASFSSLASTLGTIASYIDTEVAAIKAKTDNLPSDPADQSAVEAAIAALNNLSAAQVMAAGDIDGYTLEQALKLVLASAAAKLSGAATTTVVVRAADDSKDRITATVDASGNRTAVTLDATG